MSASVTHLVVGERILKQCYARASREVQSAFLAGCMLVDVHAFSDIPRRQTHFVGSVEQDGEDAWLRSCANFLGSLDALLQRPWTGLRPAERAFAAGYLCHLAVDECWKKLGAQLFREFGIASWADFPVPGDVSLTTFDFASAGRLIDPAGLDVLLGQIVIPDVFTHVPGALFVRQWEIIRGYVLARATPESHFRMLALAGRPETEIQEARRRYAAHWAGGLELVGRIGGAEPFLQDGVQRSLQVLPDLPAGE